LKTFSTNEILETFGVMPSHVAHKSLCLILTKLRLGFNSQNKREYGSYNYFVEPKLIVGEHWERTDRGRIIFYESALPIIIDYMNKNDNHFNRKYKFR